MSIKLRIKETNEIIYIGHSYISLACENNIAELIQSRIMTDLYNKTIIAEITISNKPCSVNFPLSHAKIDDNARWLAKQYTKTISGHINFCAKNKDRHLVCLDDFGNSIELEEFQEDSQPRIHFNGFERILIDRALTFNGHLSIRQKFES